MKQFLAIVWAVSTFAISAIAFALPSVNEVETAIRQGDWQKANTQLIQVLRAYPNNAHAHYLYGQVLAREGRPAEGLAELQKARALDPQLKFARDPARFASIEARLRAQANRAATHANALVSPSLSAAPPGKIGQPLSSAPRHSTLSIGFWLGITAIILAIALVLRFTLRRVRSSDNSGAAEQRLAQLKRVTHLLNEVRTLKLDIRLSTAPGHEALEHEVEATETQLRELTSKLSNSRQPVSDPQIESLAQCVASMKARAAGNPDPGIGNATSHSEAPTTPSPSAYAQEAEHFSRKLGGYEPNASGPPPQQSPPVVMPSPGGGFGSFGGFGGLMTGVLLGDMLSQRNRAVERDAITAGEPPKQDTQPDIDFGPSADHWDDGGNSIDLGSYDDSSNWG